MATAKHLDSTKEQWDRANSIHTVGDEAISLLKALGRLSTDRKRKTDAVAKASEIIAQRNEEVRPLLIKVRDHIAKGVEVNGCNTWEAWATHAGYSVRNLNYIVNGRKSRKDGNPGSREEPEWYHLKVGSKLTLGEGKEQKMYVVHTVEIRREKGKFLPGKITSHVLGAKLYQLDSKEEIRVHVKGGNGLYLCGKRGQYYAGLGGRVANCSKCLSALKAAA